MKKTKRLHFRRCHLCGGVTESDGIPVNRCGHCEKPMAPFYFFDEREVEPLSEAEPRPMEDRRAGERTPVRGFTAYW